MDKPKRTLQQSLKIVWIANAGLITMTALAVAAALYFALYFPPELTPEYQTRVLEEVRSRAIAHSDDLLREAGILATDTAAPLGKALLAEAREDYPLYLRALGRQGENLIEQLAEDVRLEVRKQYGDYLGQHRHVLAEEFPMYASGDRLERMLAELQQAVDRLADRYYVDEFRREANETLALWEQLVPADPPRSTEPTLDEQLAEHLRDWVALTAVESAEARLISR
jgi:hypothetical protein